MENYYRHINTPNLGKRLNSSRFIRFILLIFVTISLILNLSYANISAQPVISSEIIKLQTVFENEKAKVDFTDSGITGTVKINAVERFGGRIKVMITKNKETGATYTYDLKNDTTAELYPLQMGNGEYEIKVWFQIEDIKYGLGFKCTYSVNMSDANTPFLNPNQYVNYSEHSKTTRIAAELTEDFKYDLDKVEAIYKFVINSLEYDTDKAKAALNGQLATGYLPSVDAVIDSGKGICFDYAAVFAAMLRSQNIPAKLVVGYVKPDNTYHAWNEIYIRDHNKPVIINNMNFGGDKFEIVDPTFDSGSKSGAEVLQLIQDSANYTKIHEY